MLPWDGERRTALWGVMLAFLSASVSREVSLSAVRVGMTLMHRDKAMGTAGSRTAHCSNIPVDWVFFPFGQCRKKSERRQAETMGACAAGKTSRRERFSEEPLSGLRPGLVSREFGVRLQVLFSQDERQGKGTTG